MAPEHSRGSPARKRSVLLALLVGRFAGHGPVGIGTAMPYVLGVVGVLLFAEILWRIGIHCLNRLESHGIENLYVIGMDDRIRNQTRGLSYAVGARYQF